MALIAPGGDPQLEDNRSYPHRTKAELIEELQTRRNRSFDQRGGHRKESAEISFHKITRRIFDKCCELTGATSGYIALLSPDGEENDVLFLEAGGLPCSVDPELSMPIRGLRAEAYKLNRAVYENEFEKSQWMAFMPDGHVVLENVLFAPLVVGGRSLGLIGIANKLGGFDETDARIAQMMGDIAASALENQLILEELDQERHLISRIADTSPVGITHVDRHGAIVLANRRAEEIFGLTRSQITQRQYNDPKWRITDLEGAPFPDDNLPFLVVKRTRQPVFDSQYAIERPDGTRVLLSINASPLIDEDDEFSGIVTTIDDITELNLAVEERQSLQNQLQQSQKMESIGRLAGGVAHDFNNMLGVVLGNAELAMHEADLPQPVQENLREIKMAAERSVDLTRQLLAFARKQTIAPEVLDLNKTVAGTLKMLRRLIGEEIELVWNPGEGVWPVKVDPGQIDQVTANLSVNARDAIEGVGSITIETDNACLSETWCAGRVDATPGDYAVLAVSDSGGGIDQSLLTHIFEPFFTTKDEGQGTGLGLATVYGIVKQNDGHIEVESEPGRGSVFTIYLPRHIGKTDQLDTGGQPDARGHETVLLVEDEQALLKLGRDLLERLGYHVLNASTPGEAIEVAEKHTEPIHLLMTDVIMPEMNGRDLAAQLQGIRPNLKALFMSGYTADVIARHGVLNEGVHFIQKPFTVKVLAEKVREALE
jgi:PAS domain S-box-containing protein